MVALKISSVAIVSLENFQTYAKSFNSFVRLKIKFSLKNIPNVCPRFSEKINSITEFGKIDLTSISALSTKDLSPLKL